jgi:hypothetical protein
MTATIGTSTTIGAPATVVKLATIVTPIKAGTTTSGKTQALSGNPGILATAARTSAIPGLTEATKITAETLSSKDRNSIRDAYTSNRGGGG